MESGQGALHLSVKNLMTSFKTDSGYFPAVDGISFDLRQGEFVGLVGESGCGKSVTSLSIMRLITKGAGRIDSGEIYFDGQDLLRLTDQDMRKIRGNRISMIFQEPMTSLNPVFTVGDQISEVYRVHQGLSKKQARSRAIEMLGLVRIPAPEKRIDEYPHQLSGGMRQRVMIAMALACRPELLIADEPTTALDVTIQAQILDIMSDLRNQLNMSILLITHDLGVVAEYCDRVLVMYAGRIIESASVEELFTNPQHPYTKGLIASIPQIDVKQDILPTIKGNVPSLADRVKGCNFVDRCEKALAKCRGEWPKTTKLSESHTVHCHLFGGENN